MLNPFYSVVEEGGTRRGEKGDRPDYDGMMMVTKKWSCLQLTTVDYEDDLGQETANYMFHVEFKK